MKNSTSTFSTSNIWAGFARQDLQVLKLWSNLEVHALKGKYFTAVVLWMLMQMAAEQRSELGGGRPFWKCGPKNSVIATGTITRLILYYCSDDISFNIDSVSTNTETWVPRAAVLNWRSTDHPSPLPPPIRVGGEWSTSRIQGIHQNKPESIQRIKTILLSYLYFY